MLVMVKPSWGSPFRRSVRDAKGEIIKTLEFNQGVPLEIKDKAELSAVEGDIGNALIEVELDEKLRPKEPKAAKPAEAEETPTPKEPKSTKASK